MRIYSDYPQALNEIQRDLKEMGLRIHPSTYQDKQVGDDPRFRTLELQNYIYTVTHPSLMELEPTQPWADQEWHERLLGIMGDPVNPGVAWKTRDEVWSQFLEKPEEKSEGPSIWFPQETDAVDFKQPRFSYTYSYRFAQSNQVLRVIQRLKEDPDSRQCFIGVWWPTDSENIGGKRRVPCTLGYQVQVRAGKVNLTYLQRSADFATHFQNDLYLAGKLQHFIADSIETPVGHFTHWIGSLHVFEKDVAEVF